MRTFTDEEARRLDGTPEEFPNRDAAMAEYARLWDEFRLGGVFDAQESVRLQQAMDDAQLQISRGPGPLWQDFADSLPGYRAFWEGFRTWAGEKVAELMEKEDPREEH